MPKPKKKRTTRKQSTLTAEERSKAQKSGFTKTKLPLDSGYVKPRKDGGRAHKRGKSSKYHIDEADPEKDLPGHVIKDVVKPRIKKLLNKKKKKK